MTQTEEPVNVNATKKTGKNVTMEDIMQEIIKLCEQYPQGITEMDMRKYLGRIPTHHRVTAINKLLNEKRLAIYQDGTTLIYKGISKELADAFKGMTNDDMIIYNLIEEAGNKGIQNKELRQKTKFPTKKINTCTKNLLQRKLIKQIQTILGKSHKVWLISSIEPSSEITGGAWYKTTEKGQEYNYELILQLQQASLDCLKRQKIATVDDMLHFALTRGIKSESSIRRDDMQYIVDTLIFDSLIEPVQSSELSDDSNVIRYKENGVSTPESNIFSEIPCGTCPIFDRCSDDGDICPATCKYYNEWLEF